ncbi:haloacid dehalogenase [Pullulanibacillus camelliae]|uniref:Haloacid dehalogenase n=1 Tax=Pullulanibacillus camelliae TaxID=1707096 RepID=A0A8J2YLL7_9BACL|nr:Cof-type HAD-IIB family hydrolase [Pullulanibacillus camelliae]GGE51028.1 haloacid dehalogenase [Pullulanibacillus camelliae]
MNQYLIALDLDGTLLTSDKTISPKTKETLGRVIKAGHKVMIATGRPFRASQEYYHALQLDTPIVNFNGAYIHHPLDPNWGVYHSPLDFKTFHDIMSTCQSYQLKNVVVEVKDEVFINNPDPLLTDLVRIGNPNITYGPIQDHLTQGPTSVLLQTNEQKIDKLINALDTEHANAIEQRSWGYPTHIIEIIKRGINKAIGIEKTAAYYGIPKERMIAFGDEDNDIEMLQYVGQGVAMGNAISALKAIANAVTSSNDEEGIADYLEKTLLA